MLSTQRTINNQSSSATAHDLRHGLDQVSLEVNLKAVFEVEEPREGMPLVLPSFTMFVTSSEGLGDTWGQREAIDDMEAIFRDRIVLVKRDELFESNRPKREVIYVDISTVSTPVMPDITLPGSGAVPSANDSVASSPPRSSSPLPVAPSSPLPVVPSSPNSADELWTSADMSLSPDEVAELERVETMAAPALARRAGRGRSALSEMTPQRSHMATTHAHGVNLTPGPPNLASTSSAPTRSRRRQQQRSAPPQSQPVDSSNPTRAGNRPARNRRETPQRAPPQSPAAISSAHVSNRSHAVRIPDSPMAANGNLPRPSLLPPPPYTPSPPLAPPVSYPSSPPPDERIDSSIVLALDVLDLDHASRLLVLRCVLCTPGYPQDQWEDILEHGGLTHYQIDILLPLMNADYYGPS